MYICCIYKWDAIIMTKEYSFSYIKLYGKYTSRQGREKGKNKKSLHV